MHGGTFTHPSIITSLALESFRQFQRANATNLTQEAEEGANAGLDGVCNKWRAPLGFYKANWDIAVSVVKKCMRV